MLINTGLVSQGKIYMSHHAVTMEKAEFQTAQKKRDFHDGQVVKTLCFQCKVCGLDP